MVVRVPVTSPDPARLGDLATARDVLWATLAAAKRVGLSLRLAPESGPPPCVFAQPAAVSSLYALTPGGRPPEDHVHPEGCAGRAVRDRRPGVHLSLIHIWRRRRAT